MLTAAVRLQGDDTGQRELHEGRYHARVESPGLPQQPLGCIRKREAADVLLWKDLEGVFTSGLMTEQGTTDTVRGHTAWQGHRRPARVMPGLGATHSFAPTVSSPGPPPLIYWLLFVLQISMGFPSPGMFPDPVG